MISKEKLHRFLAAKRSPELAVFNFLNGADELTKKLITDAIKKAIGEAQSAFDSAIKELEGDIETIKGQIPSIKKEIARSVFDGVQTLIRDNVGAFKGKDGSDGKDGLNGKDGRNGQDGRDGRDGIDGRNGINGKDGKTPVPNRDYLSKEATEILIKDILDEFIKDTKKRLATMKGGSKGGGMGNTQHETFPISVGTVSVQTAYGISGNGNAIFKSAYQGQILDKDVHFVVGSDNRTITFDSDVVTQFVNDTVFSITYVRG